MVSLKRMQRRRGGALAPLRTSPDERALLCRLCGGSCSCVSGCGPCRLWRIYSLGRIRYIVKHGAGSQIHLTLLPFAL